MIEEAKKRQTSLVKRRCLPQTPNPSGLALLSDARCALQCQDTSPYLSQGSFIPKSVGGTVAGKTLVVSLVTQD
jgi:hypothetical protein